MARPMPRLPPVTIGVLPENIAKGFYRGVPLSEKLILAVRMTGRLGHSNRCGRTSKGFRATPEIAKKPTENCASACALFEPIRQASASVGNVESSWNGQLPGNLQQWPPRISVKQFQFARSHRALQVFTFFDGPKLLNIRTE